MPGRGPGVPEGLSTVAAFVLVGRLMPELTGHGLEHIDSHRAEGRFKSADFADDRGGRTPAA